jgi:iron complex transport system substrate-binding protein
MPAESPRIVSLIASSTEILCALGLEPYLVARSHECDYPPSIRRLPACTEAKLQVEAPSAEIDRQVKAIVEQALSVYRVDSEQLRALRPTHIVTQTQCEVCAVSPKDVKQALSEWLGLTSLGRPLEEPKIVSLAPFALADLWTDIQQVADAFEIAERGSTLVRALQSRMKSIAATAQLAVQSKAQPPVQRTVPPSVACIEWIAPLMASGNWMPELVEMAGGRNLFGEAGLHAPWLEWSAVVVADPDYLLILPCGFDIARIRREMPALTALAGWKELRAVRQGRVYLLDGNQYFNRPGPRLVESLEILAEILHPETFRFGHQGTGWQLL